METAKFIFDLIIVMSSAFIFGFVCGMMFMSFRKGCVVYQYVNKESEGNI